MGVREWGAVGCLWVLGCSCGEEPSGMLDGGAPGSADTGVSSQVDASEEPAVSEEEGDAALSAAPDATMERTDAGVPVVGAATECFPEPLIGVHVVSCGGLRFDLSVPDTCQAGCGVILDVHGFSMSGAMQENNTGLQELAGSAGYIVIQPNATPFPPLSAWSEDDDARVFDFLMQVVDRYAADRNRLHMTGFSMGGFMTWRFACKHADILASVAPVAACASSGSDGLSGCAFEGEDVPSEQIPILYMHGEFDDNLVDYACAEPQVEAVTQHWSMIQDAVVSGEGFERRK